MVFTERAPPQGFCSVPCSLSGQVKCLPDWKPCVERTVGNKDQGPYQLLPESALHASLLSREVVFQVTAGRLTGSLLSPASISGGKEP